VNAAAESRSQRSHHAAVRPAPVCVQDAAGCRSEARTYRVKELADGGGSRQEQAEPRRAILPPIQWKKMAVGPVGPTGRCGL
ncbi:hypothetical protein EJB05_17173, partial [Eragrostis curvula]